MLGRRRPRVYAVFAALVAVSAALAGLACGGDDGDDAADQVPVPDVVGQQASDGNEALKAEGFEVE